MTDSSTENLYIQGLLNFDLGTHSVGETRKKHLQTALKVFDRLESPYDSSRLKNEQGL
jgi:hypothetical protein